MFLTGNRSSVFKQKDSGDTETTPAAVEQASDKKE